MGHKLKKLLKSHAIYPKNTAIMFALAVEYDTSGQGAAAVSFYIRCADLEESKPERHRNIYRQYQCMIRAAWIYERCGNRQFTVLGLLQHAASLRPSGEAVNYLLSKFYQNRGDWRQSLIYAKMGQSRCNADHDIDESKNDLGYPGIFGLKYQEAIANWNISGTELGKQQLFNVMIDTDANPEHRNMAKETLNKIGYPDVIAYDIDYDHKLQTWLTNYSLIQNNYSKHFQDMFVINALGGKNYGTYLEIGSGDPFIHNNTALLETEYNWKGISIDVDPALCAKFKQNRMGTVLCKDARKTDYNTLLTEHSMPDVIDYLQIDCDEASLEILKLIPFNSYKFNVITFEHDAYRLGADVKESAKKLLEEEGYVLFVNNIAFAPNAPYEDWYVHKDMVDKVKVKKSTKDINFILDYIREA